MSSWRADGTICQTHLSSGSPAATSLIIITLAWWMDLCGGTCQVWVNTAVTVWYAGWDNGQELECFQMVLSLDNCVYVVGTTQHVRYASGQHRLSFPYTFVLSLSLMIESTHSFLSFTVHSFFCSPLSFLFLFLSCLVLSFLLLSLLFPLSVLPVLPFPFFCRSCLEHLTSFLAPVMFGEFN